MEAHKDVSSASPLDELLESSEKLPTNAPVMHYFTSFDYGLFGLMLLLSAVIGIYFGFFAKRKQNNTTEYLLGGKKMTFFPIAASLIASHINGFTMLAVPAEVYAHGSEYSLCVISAVLVSLAPFCSKNFLLWNAMRR
jgi:Sodium:solute symporter family